MKPISHEPRNFGVIFLLFLLMLLASGLLGCAHTGKRGIQVIPKSNESVLTLSADDVVQVMQRAGFTDMQILQYGTEVHNALAQSGGVIIKVNQKAEAVFAVKGNSVHIATRLRGTFFYNVRTGF